MRVASSGQMLVYYDEGSGTPTRDIFVSGPAGHFATAPDRVVVQAVNRTNPSVAMTATVTVNDTGDACDYVVQASSTG